MTKPNNQEEMQRREGANPVGSGSGEEPQTREEFLQYSCQLKMDLNTAHKALHLDEGHRQAASGGTQQAYPDCPERFDYWHQVLCKEGLTGRHYWEVGWNGKGVNVAVAYKGMRRKGDSKPASLGFNDQSWSLQCTPTKYYFWHNWRSIAISGPLTYKIGVYLDHSAGTLSFYNVSDTMTLLYRVHTVFTEPLYPAFKLSKPGLIRI
ncbi:tripartite motif-containing protein 16-like protein [Paramormyrops kingsleyae]|uniref:tripartite motif-containing protein 16-like protein n=1 Tax=Paramormyrops kingsleyae TaxID=1676925 RepID=UPI000CD5F2AA|nr:tripartite motif-containing protein 16-like protein isoform X2 [Paramormyrops kingsleyae]